LVCCYSTASKVKVVVTFWCNIWIITLFCSSCKQISLEIRIKRKIYFMQFNLFIFYLVIVFQWCCQHLRL
jgi:hypothetical protein